MSLWESIGDTYVDAAKSALPLHRVVVVLIGFVGAIATRKQTHLSLLETISNLPFKGLNFEGSGFLEAARLGDVLVGLGLALAGWAVAKAIVRLVFAWAAKLTDFKRRIGELPKLAGQSVSELETALKILDTSLAQPKNKLRAMSAAAELCSGVGVAALIGSVWGNVLDASVGITFLGVAFAVQFNAVRFFFSDYLGPALHKAKLLGKKVPSLADVGE